MADDSSKILGMAINSLVRTNSENEVNELIKSCLEIGTVSVDDSFKYLEDDISSKVGETLSRSTFIDIMKSVKNIEDISNISKVCEDSENFRKAKNFMKVANPKFFEDLQSKRIEDEKRYAEKIKMMYDMKKMYMDTIHKQQMINSKLDDYEEEIKKNDLMDLYKKYNDKKKR